jgi:succinate dehydrogenase (ubiquinone) membrane anchor subunit
LANGAWSVTPKSVGISKNTQYEYFQLTTWAMAAALPIGFIFSPSILNLPVDLVLGFAVPFHAWYGMHHVVEDYIPAAYQPASNMLLYLITAVTVLGLLNLNFRGDGIVESIKGLWREEDKDKKASSK